MVVDLIVSRTFMVSIWRKAFAASRLRAFGLRRRDAPDELVGWDWLDAGERNGLELVQVTTQSSSGVNCALIKRMILNK